MAETNNQTKYLDLAGLTLLVEKIKAGDAVSLAAAKTYVGSLEGKTVGEVSSFTDVIDYLEKKIAAAQAAATFDGKASSVSITDSGNIFTADNVEGALAEVKAIADANKTALETVNGDASTSGSLAKVLKDAKDYTDSEIGELKIGETSYSTVKAYVDAKDSAIVKLIDATNGDLSTLTTDVKTDVVSAINEVDAHVDANTTAIGTAKSGETAGTGLTGRIEVLEAAVGEGGGVSDQIDAKINLLDSEKSSTAVETGKGIQVTVKEVDGKIDSVTVTGDYSQSYDALGAAAAVQGETTETVASLKSAIDGLGTAADADVATVVIGGAGEDTNALPTVGQVKSYVADQIADLEGAMHFVGVITREEGETDEQAIARVITDAAPGDVVVMADNSKEYIFVDPDPETEGDETWREVGDEGLYVQKATTIAGVDLQDNITKAELLTALNVADGAQVNVIESVKVNGTALSITDKAVDVTIGTGDTNGTVKVNNVEVAVKGLGSAAYTDSTAYDAAGTADALVGDLDDLTTTAKGTVVAAINEVKSAVGAVDYSGKADKVASAVSGNFAGLDENGNLTDSGKKAADFDVAGAAAAVSGYGQGETAQTVKQVAEKVDAIIAITTDEITDLFTEKTEE